MFRRVRDEALRELKSRPFTFHAKKTSANVRHGKNYRRPRNFSPAWKMMKCRSRFGSRFFVAKASQMIQQGTDFACRMTIAVCTTNPASHELGESCPNLMSRRLNLRIAVNNVLRARIHQGTCDLILTTDFLISSSRSRFEGVRGNFRKSRCTLRFRFTVGRVRRDTPSL